MEILKIIGLLISFILIMVGVIAIFDARKLTEKWFSFSDKNEASKWLKIGGLIISVVGCIIIFLLK